MPETENNKKSKCCHAPVIVVGSVTKWYECQICCQPCDIVKLKRRDKMSTLPEGTWLEATEEIFKQLKVGQAFLYKDIAYSVCKLAIWNEDDRDDTLLEWFDTTEYIMLIPESPKSKTKSERLAEKINEYLYELSGDRIVDCNLIEIVESVYGENK